MNSLERLHQTVRGENGGDDFLAYALPIETLPNRPDVGVRFMSFKEDLTELYRKGVYAVLTVSEERLAQDDVLHDEVLNYIGVRFMPESRIRAPEWINVTNSVEVIPSHEVSLKGRNCLVLAILPARYEIFEDISTSQN